MLLKQVKRTVLINLLDQTVWVCCTFCAQLIFLHQQYQYLIFGNLNHQSKKLFWKQNEIVQFKASEIQQKSFLCFNMEYIFKIVFCYFKLKVVAKLRLQSIQMIWHEMQFVHLLLWQMKIYKKYPKI